MSLALTAATFENLDNIENKKSNEKLSTVQRMRSKKNGTVKNISALTGGSKEGNSSDKVSKALEEIHSVHNVNNGSTEEGLANFEPLGPPESVGVNRKEDSDSKKNKENITDVNGDREFTPEQFAQISQAATSEYSNQYVPFFANASDNVYQGGRDTLMEKLNYVIHLLEEQKDEKTDHVTEEVVLYCFLGVFVIFVTDSFARAGKYAR
tara:strand:+ start:109 stop:735 length:627 start_codon:yes stop_codon:yes gene_type:complete